MKVKTSLKENEKTLKKLLTAFDITFCSINFGKSKALVVFIEAFCDKDAVGNLVLKPLTEFTETPTESDVQNLILSPSKKPVNTFAEVEKELFFGSTLLFVDGISKAFSFSLKQYEKRAVSEPPTSAVVKGPREGFVESIESNIGLLRRRLKTPDLALEIITMGKYSQTPIALCYIKGVVKKGLVEKVTKKLKQVSIDAIIDSSYIAQLLSEHESSLFKQVGTTEKPDVLTAKMLEGRLAILVEGSPIALTLPYMLWEDFQNSEDYFVSTYKATKARILRLCSVLISLLLPAFYVSAQLFHLQLIPLSFLLTIVNSVKGIPLSPSFEMFFTLLIFVILNETSVRMPKHVGMVVSIVGGLVLGETAVNAGIISAPALMIVAFSGICLYTVPDLEKSFSVIRFVLLLIAGTIGAYGLVLAGAYMLTYLTSFENYDTPLLAPFAPLVKEDLKDGLFKEYLSRNDKRPKTINSPNKRRFKKL